MLKIPVSKRINLVENDNYSVDLEFNKEFAILHLPYVHKLTKSVYQDMLVKTQEIWDFLSTVGYDAMFIAIHPDDTTLAKFVMKLGFVHLGNADGLGVYQYKEYV